uniref:Tc3 transposase DNA binding domain-containing protein n=1 Tax=Gasterosteus aculeatus aculeatus TaxID=481459 RepID=A0AAQ4QD88_GASAC
MGKKGDLSHFERGMVVGARQAGLSISPSAQLLGFSRTTIFRVHKEWCEKGKTSSMWQSCGLKCLVDARGQRRMGRLIQADRRATLTEITTRYNRGMQQSICEATTRTTLRRPIPAMSGCPRILPPTGRDGEHVYIYIPLTQRSPTAGPQAIWYRAASQKEYPSPLVNMHIINYIASNSAPSNEYCCVHR